MTRFIKQTGRVLFPSLLRMVVAVLLAALLAASCGFKRKKYENPITKETQQPDKVLFDKSVKDIEHGRFELARLTLNTLINTYDSSEYLAKAKLAIADSWYREGGSKGLAQAEAEYKDFILFYPTMEEAAESQERICMIHFNQMDKADRDPNNALRAEQECRNLITQFPNSKFVPAAEQRLREVQEVLAESEMRTGDFYHKKGSNAAAANRLEAVVSQYPLYSRADEALWEAADSYSRMGPRFRQRDGDVLTKLVKDYPLSPYAELAKKKLEAMELPVPEADPAAVARMKYEAANRTKIGTIHRNMDNFRRTPEVASAAKSGTPTMTNPKGSIPASVPAPPGSTGVNEVTLQPVSGSTALDTNPDARAKAPESSSAASTAGTPAPGTPPAASSTTPSAPGASATAAGTPAVAAPSPTAQKQADPQQVADSKIKKKKKKNKSDQAAVSAQPAATPAPAAPPPNQ
jgi:outer membrane protein assembly factor BamD